MKRSHAFGIWLVCTLAFGLFAWRFSDGFVVFCAETRALRVTKEFFEGLGLCIDWFDRAFDDIANDSIWMIPFNVMGIMIAFVISVLVGLVFTLPFVVGLNLAYFVDSLTGWPCVVFWTSLVSICVANGLYQRLDSEPVKEE
jgi:hypothetical protein